LVKEQGVVSGSVDLDARHDGRWLLHVLE
jgi:hypothetical protein